MDKVGLEQFEQFVYPPYGTTLAGAYGGRFEAVFILLHPFIRMPEQLAWNMTRRYPSDNEIAALGAACTWAEVAKATGLTSCARLNQALLTACGSLTAEFADREGKNALQRFLQSAPIWMPAQGRFEPLLQSKLLRMFLKSGADQVLYVPESPGANPIERLKAEDLRNGKVPFPPSGSLVAPDASFLFTVDWDSFFTLFYGAREFLVQMARELEFEGFFATANTDHAWFNFSLGCATVTLSPEHWQVGDTP